MEYKFTATTGYESTNSVQQMFEKYCYQFDTLQTYSHVFIFRTKVIKYIFYFKNVYLYFKNKTLF